MDAPQGHKRAALDPVAMTLLGVGIAAALLLLVNDLRAAASQPGYSINGLAIWGHDFANLWSAGRLVIEGRTDILYDVPAYQAWQAAALGPGIGYHNYSYPPVTLLFAPVFGALPYPVALALWLSGSALAFFAAARPWLARAGLASGWVVLLPSTLLCLWAGHYGLLLGALWLAAWHRLDERPVSAGVAVGLMLVKPHLALLMPLMLARRGAWRAFAAAGATVAVLVIASLLLFGPELWRTYLTSTSGVQLALVGEPRKLFGLMMPTVVPSLIALGVTPAMAWAGQYVSAAAAVALLMLRQPADRYRAGLAAATATFLVLPYAFNYDMTVVGLAALLVMVEASRGGRRGEAALAGLAVALPTVMMYFNMFDVRIAPLVMGGLLVLLVRRR